ncbi:hypothetical protein J2T16_001766 [Paenibacillus intestini]|nr:hypothetical protein [Paenibacillus intestini]
MTIGDVLLQPENGWIRFDGGDNSITKAGSWLTASHVNYYNGIGHYTQTQGASFSFSFYGRAFRIIDQRSSNRTKNATVMIDGVSQTVNFSLANDPNQSVVYEKLNLNPGFHTVTVTKNDATSSTLLLSVDAVDIKLPYNKFLISSEDEILSVIDDGIKLLPSSLESVYVNHGMSKNFAIDVNTLRHKKQIIKSTSTLLGSGKVFKQKIDKNNIPIKKASIT